jgi:hypothetical protein
MFEAGRMIAPTLGHRPGRPRDVHSLWWWVDHPDGTVSYCIVRRQESGAPSGLTLAFHGETDDQARAAYEEWVDLQHERTQRNAARRARWGPAGTGKMA